VAHALFPVDLDAEDAADGLVPEGLEWGDGLVLSLGCAGLDQVGPRFRAQALEGDGQANRSRQ